MEDKIVVHTQQTYSYKSKTMEKIGDGLYMIGVILLFVLSILIFAPRVLGGASSWINIILPWTVNVTYGVILFSGILTIIGIFLSIGSFNEALIETSFIFRDQEVFYVFRRPKEIHENARFSFDFVGEDTYNYDASLEVDVDESTHTVDFVNGDNGANSFVIPDDGEWREFVALLEQHGFLANEENPDWPEDRDFL